jgi:hypothetical protein
MKHLKLFEDNKEELVSDLTPNEYDQWVKWRYKGLPNEEAKWAMIECIDKFEKWFLEHNPDSLTKYLNGKYEDKFMSKSYIEGTNHQKLQWQYWTDGKFKVPDFVFAMFEGDDDYYIVHLVFKRMVYYYKVDDIIGIKKFFDEVTAE